MTPADASRRTGFRDRLARVRAATPSGRRSLPLALGSVLTPLGLVLVGLAWLGASRTPVLQEQVAYLVSGGLGGLCLVVVGSALLGAHWQTEQVHETRSQTTQLLAALHDAVAALDRVAEAAAGAGSRLVATPNGTLVHRDTCQVVRRRSDLRPVAPDEPGLAPCRLCLPT